MSDREAARHLEDKYMLAVAEASFPTADPDLVKAAGPCGTCPKRTGNQPELFNDVRGAGFPAWGPADFPSWGPP